MEFDVMENANWNEYLESEDDDQEAGGSGQSGGIEDKARRELGSNSGGPKRFEVKDSASLQADIDLSEKKLADSWDQLKNNPTADAKSGTQYRGSLDKVIELRLAQIPRHELDEIRQSLKLAEGQPLNRGQALAILEKSSLSLPATIQSAANLCKLIGETDDDRVFNPAAYVAAKEELIAEQEKAKGKPLSAEEKKRPVYRIE